MTDPKTRHGRGLAVVILLALIFFTLITLIVVKSGKSRPEAVREAEMLTVLPATLRLRTEPNARSPIVARSKMGDRLKLLEDRGAWVHVETADGYQYYFAHGQVRGNTFFGTLVEDVEEVGDDGEMQLTTQSREVPIPISTILRVDSVRRGVSANTLYLAGALGAGAVIYAAVSGSDEADVTTRGTGPATKPPPR